MRITILPLIFVFSAIIFLGGCNTAFAQDNDIGQSIIHPAHPLYFLKTVREGLEMHFAQTPKVKFIRQLEFATRRLREVKSLIPTNRQDLIETTMERYWHQISNLPDKNLQIEGLAKEISDSLVIHIKTLEKVYLQVSNQRAKMAIRSALNRLMSRQDIPSYARIPVCEFFSKEATSSAVVESERAILTERAQNCFKGSGYKI